MDTNEDRTMLECEREEERLAELRKIDQLMVRCCLSGATLTLGELVKQCPTTVMVFTVKKLTERFNARIGDEMLVGPEPKGQVSRDYWAYHPTTQRRATLDKTLLSALSFVEYRQITGKLAKAVL